MISEAHLLWLLTHYSLPTKVTIFILFYSQIPESLSTLHKTVTNNCKANLDMSDRLAWHAQRPGQAPKLLIQFFCSGSGADFTLTNSSVEADDAVVCYDQLPCSTVIRISTTKGRTKLEIKRDNAKPSAFIFHPSAEQLKGGTASVVCLVNGFYPSALEVDWKVDNTVTTTGVLTSSAQQDTSDRTYSLSSTLTLTKAQYDSHESYTCEVKHATGSLAKSFKRSECLQ
uniref:Immunoglobulin kappa constant n=1 Tax=Pelusios castaneus TaxID=367368 RepID=A0A8C8SLY4_9SAUR